MKRPVPVTASIIVFILFALLFLLPVFNAVDRISNPHNTPIWAIALIMIILVGIPAILIAEAILLYRNHRLALIISKAIVSFLILMFLISGIIGIMKNSNLSILIPVILPVGFLIWLLVELFNNNVKEYFNKNNQ